MAPHAIRLIVFDLDGTLIDSSADLCNSVNAALTFSGKPTLPDDLITSYIGDGAAMLIRRAIGDPGDLDSLNSQTDFGLFRTTYEFFLSYYQSHKLDNTHCYSGVMEALTQIQSAKPDVLMAVLTNKPVKPSREICRSLKLSPFFFQNYGGNSFESKKPDPAGLLTIIEEASQLLRNRADSSSLLLPEEVIMIGDSDVDVITARRCGVRSIGCAFGLAPVALAASKPDAMVRHPSEWPATISGIWTG